MIDTIPADFFSPPAITQPYQSSKNSIMGYSFPGSINSYKRQDIISIADNKIMLNIINYTGFESTINSFNNCKNDAISRYKIVYKADEYNTELVNPFLNAIKTIVYNSRFIPKFYFYPDGARAIFIINQQEITIEYDFEEPTSILVSKFIDEELYIKDATIDNLGLALGAFL